MAVNLELNRINKNFKKYSNIKSKKIIDFCSNISPDISIMIPTYKRSHLLKEAIDSVINQNTDLIFEIVIVDNDSDCEYLNEIESLIYNYKSQNIRYFRNESNIGMFGNWNRCIELARGKWISILNDDDCLKQNFILETSKWLNKNGLIFVDIESAKSSEEMSQLLNRPLKTLNSSNIVSQKLSDLFWRNPVNGSLGAIFEKDKAISIGGYDELLYPTSDYHFTFNYWKKFGAHRIKNKCAIYRWGENESMKTNTLKLFLINNMKLRRDIIDKNVINNEIIQLSFSLVSSYLAMRESLAYQSVNPMFSAKRELRNIDVYSGPLVNLIVNPLMSMITKVVVFMLNFKGLRKYFYKEDFNNG